MLYQTIHVIYASTKMQVDNFIYIFSVAFLVLMLRELLTCSSWRKLYVSCLIYSKNVYYQS